MKRMRGRRCEITYSRQSTRPPARPRPFNSTSLPWSPTCPAAFLLSWGPFSCFRAHFRTLTHLSRWLRFSLSSGASWLLLKYLTYQSGNNAKIFLSVKHPRRFLLNRLCVLHGAVPAPFRHLLQPTKSVLSAPSSASAALKSLPTVTSSCI